MKFLALVKVTRNTDDTDFPSEKAELKENNKRFMTYIKRESLRWISISLPYSCSNIVVGIKVYTKLPEKVQERVCFRKIHPLWTSSEFFFLQKTAHAFSGHSQTSKMKLYSRIINCNFFAYGRNRWSTDLCSSSGRMIHIKTFPFCFTASTEFISDSSNLCWIASVLLRRNNM